MPVGVRGRVYDADVPGGVAASVAVRADRIEARDEQGRGWTIALSDATVQPGGFDGQHVFVRGAAGTLTVASDDPALLPALEAVADARLAPQLAAVAEHRRRHARRTALERWAYRLRYPALLVLLVLVAALIYASLKR